MNPISVDSAAEFVGRMAASLANQLGTDVGVRSLVARLGWDELPSVPAVFDDLHQSAALIAQAVGELTLARLEDDPTKIAAAVAKVTAGVVALVSDIDGLPAALDSQLPQAYRDATGIAARLGPRLVDLLLIEAIRDSSGGAYALLYVLGLIEETSLDEEPAAHQPVFELREVRLDRLKTFLTKPFEAMKDVYGWGTPEIKAERLYRSINLASMGLLSPSELAFPSDALVASMFANVPAGTDIPSMLNVPIGSGDAVPLEIAVLPAPKATTTENQGLALRLIGTPEGKLTFPIGQGLVFELDARAALDTGIGVLLRPSQTPELLVGIETGGSPLLEGGVGVALRRSDIESPLRVVSFGKFGGLDVQGFHVSAELDAVRKDLALTAAIDQGHLTLSFSETDGFLRKVVPEQALSLEFNLGVGWSNVRGFFVTGSAGLELTFPIHETLGPLSIEALRLALRIVQEGVRIEVGADFGLAMGPVQATVEGIGVVPELEFKKGNLGPLNLDVGFLAPRGVGIAVNAGPVAGGGFLKFEDDRYSGALELQIYSVAVKAFGVIDTKLPDGSPGFSFVIVISAEFTAIQLGLGFTLLGVGGLLGINRRLDRKALESAVREGGLQNVLFPTNVVQRAPEIVRDLTALFPPTDGRYVFGPMAKIGWGTPTLIHAELGIILELPGPILSLLGEVRCALPREEAALVKLNLSVAGRLDFAEKTFEMFAALHDSVIAGYPVKGQMAMKLRWGPQPVFALSIGGFHPAYSPPPGFPALQPMTVDLGKNGNPGITLTGFFAITSNTVQVGGALALRASGSGVTLEATLSVKAIFVFAPFSFEAEIDAKVRVAFHGHGIGVRLHGMLSGPSPWRIAGKVCVSILWWDACLSFDKTFGGGDRVSVPEINPFTGTEKALGDPEDIPGLGDAIADQRSWEPVAPAGVFSAVTLAQGAGDKPPFDPMGGLSMRQKVVPLETQQKIDRFGVANAQNPRVFKLTKATAGANAVDLKRGIDLRDNFAPAQFFAMDATHKLSAPSFVEQTAGYTFTANTNDAQAGSVGGTDLSYETIVVDTRPNPPPTNVGDYLLPEGHLVGMLKRSAAGVFGLHQQGDLRYVDFEKPDRFGFKTPKFVPADKSTLTERTGLFGATNKLEAILSFEEHVLANPTDSDALQVVPDLEVFKAA